MTRKKPREHYIGAARERARQRGLWGAICGLTMTATGFLLTGYYLWILVGWHARLHHAGRPFLFGGRPIEFWELIPVLSLLPFMAIAGIILNCLIWLIPPVRRLSERPSRHNPSLGFVPMQIGLLQALKWTFWLIPLGVVAAWLAP